MVSGLVSLWMMAAAAQAPAAEAGWLKAVPADAEIVVRVRGLDAAGADLKAMVQAMSPTLAQQANPAIDNGLEQFRTRFGAPASASPFLVLLKLPKPDAPPGPPPFAVLVQSDSYEGVLKSLAGPNGKAEPKRQAGGYDAITDQDGDTLYTVKGAGFVAFGQSEALVGQIAKPKETLDRKLGADIQAGLFGGDVGLYINGAAINSRFGEQIEQARQGFLAIMDQVGGQMGPGMGDALKTFYGGLFDAVKQVDALALNLDAAREGLNLVGQVTTKGASDRKARVGTAELLGRLPADAAYFTYFDIDPKALAGLQRMGMSFMAGAGKPTPEMQKALDAQVDLGPTQAYGAASIANGIRGVNITAPSDVKKAAEVGLASLKASKGMAFIKDIQIAENDQAYKGIKFTKVVTTMDLDKIAKMQPNNPGGVEAIRSMFGGDTTTQWFGSDGKLVYQVTAKDWESARKQLDPVLSGEGGIGQTAGFKAVREKLPREVTVLFLVSSQGFVRQMYTQLAAMMPGAANAKPPADLPKEPALFGGAVTAVGGGYRFQFVLPSSNGPVFEQGFIPLVRGLQGGVDR